MNNNHWNVNKYSPRYPANPLLTTKYNYGTISTVNKFSQNLKNDLEKYLKHYSTFCFLTETKAKSSTPPLATLQLVWGQFLKIHLWSDIGGQSQHHQKQ